VTLYGLCTDRLTGIVAIAWAILFGLNFPLDSARLTKNRNDIKLGVMNDPALPVLPHNLGRRLAARGAPSTPGNEQEIIFAGKSS
jgi:hypothetical protein